MTSRKILSAWSSVIVCHKGRNPYAACPERVPHADDSRFVLILKGRIDSSMRIVRQGAAHHLIVRA